MANTTSATMRRDLKQAKLEQACQDKEYEYLIADQALMDANLALGNANILQCVTEDHHRRVAAAQRLRERAAQEYIKAASAAGKPHHYTDLGRQYTVSSAT